MKSFHGMDCLKEFQSTIGRNRIQPVRKKTRMKQFEKLFWTNKALQNIQIKTQFWLGQDMKRNKNRDQFYVTYRKNSKQKEQIEKLRTLGNKADEDCFVYPSVITVDDEHLNVTIDSS